MEIGTIIAGPPGEIELYDPIKRGFAPRGPANCMPCAAKRQLGAVSAENPHKYGRGVPRTGAARNLLYPPREVDMQKTWYRNGLVLEYSAVTEWRTCGASR